MSMFRGRKRTSEEKTPGEVILVEGADYFLHGIHPYFALDLDGSNHLVLWWNHPQAYKYTKVPSRTNDIYHWVMAPEEWVSQ